MSQIILLAKALINGVIYRGGDDIAAVATPGEIESLRACGLVSRGPVEIVEMVRGEAVELPDGWSLAQETPADEVPAPVIPEQVIPEPGDDWRSLHVSTFHPDNALPEGSSVTLDADVVDLLIAGKLATLGQLSDHLEQHGHFRGIRGIGKATSPKIEAALQTFLTGLQ